MPDYNNFNRNPSAFVDLNDLFPQLNEKVGLSATQFQKLVENTFYLLNHLGLADVDVGTIRTNYTAPGTFADVVVTHRDTEVDGKIIDYFDYVFNIPTPKIETTASATLSNDDNDVAATVTPTPIKNSDNVTIGYSFAFDLTVPRGIQGVKGVSFRNCGHYSESLTYVNNDTYIDFVHYNGSLYCPRVTQTTAGILPTDTSEWSLMVSKGDKGTSIVNVQKTATNGLVDTYTMTFDDNHSYTFTVTNGAEQDITGKADKVNNATNGNLAQLDANGNLVDSGKKASDFLTSHQDVSGKENSSNKVSSITTSNNTSEILYPNVKAVVGYVDALLGEIASELRGV